MTIWLISDTHFGHEAMYGFTETFDGVERRVRFEFANASEGDEFMMDRWAETVKPGDHVYHLGDVAMKKEFLPMVKKLPGQKRLVLGNHDREQIKHYQAAGFQKIFGSRVFEGLVATHVPIHPLSLGSRFIGNVHGHIHRQPAFGPRYKNVSVEVIGYTPIALDDVIAEFNHLPKAV